MTAASFLPTGKSLPSPHGEVSSQVVSAGARRSDTRSARNEGVNTKSLIPAPSVCLMKEQSFRILKASLLSSDSLGQRELRRQRRKELC